MQKRIRLVLILVLIMLIAGMTIKRSFDMAGDGKKDTIANKNIDETIESDIEMPDELQNCQDSVVAIQCECGSGNGVLLCEKEDSYVFCTAAHVLQGLSGLKTDEMQIGVAESEATVKGFWISHTYDVAFIEVAKEGLPDVSEGKKETGLSDAGYRNLKEEDMLLVWSFYGGEYVSTEVKVKSPWIYVEDFGYHMIWGEAQNAKGGMSGSGVFDCDGHLAGILCGGNDAEVAVLPVNIILGELKNSSIDISQD